MAETFMPQAALDGAGPQSDAAVLRTYDLFKRYGSTPCCEGVESASVGKTITSPLLTHNSA